jgi:thiosulfate reductase cytochrome b subunit
MSADERKLPAAAEKGEPEPLSSQPEISAPSEAGKAPGVQAPPVNAGTTSAPASNLAPVVAVSDPVASASPRAAAGIIEQGTTTVESSAPAVEPPEASGQAPGTFVAAYEHSSVVRFCHWLNAVALLIMMASGWRIFIAFPSFGPRIPEQRLLKIPGAITLGGWLGGALQWHYTFMWVFAFTGLVYVGYLMASGEYKIMLFRPRDIPGVWPMVRHYFFFAPEPKQTEPYNALQKLAYTTIVLCGAVSVLTGIVILRPVQFSGLAWLMGGFHLARVWHFVAMCGFVAFIPGHLVMVALHGWNNFMSMVRGWKKNPQYS